MCKMSNKIGQKNHGKRMYDFVVSVFHICRSLTGEGVRRTLKAINDYIAEDNLKFEMYEIPTGTQVFDWTIPKEWIIREAYIENESGKKIIDMEKNNLHVMGYSTSVDEWVSLDELKRHIFTQPDQPDVVPYVTSYYCERFGFCMSEKQLESLPEGKYHMYIDSDLINGSLTYADLVIEGESDEEILIQSYICHPSMANDNCSGPAVLTELVKYVNSLESRRYTYRFVLAPETIGSIAYLSRNYKHLHEKLTAGIVLSCVGDDRDYSIIESRYANTIADKSLKNILGEQKHYTTYSYLERGSDERQYNSPGIELPVVGFCRTQYGVYPEYHTSADNLDLISPSGLEGAYDVMVRWIQAMEYNKYYRVTVCGEPQLGKRGLYRTISQKGSYDEVRALFDFIAYADGKNDLFDISNIIKIPVSRLIPIVEKLKNSELLEVADSCVSQC